MVTRLIMIVASYLKLLCGTPETDLILYSNANKKNKIQIYETNNFENNLKFQKQKQIKTIKEFNIFYLDSFYIQINTYYPELIFQCVMLFYTVLLNQ